MIKYIKSFKDFIPTWVICAFLFFWIFIWPLIIAVILLIIQCYQRKKMNGRLEYGILAEKYARQKDSENLDLIIKNTELSKENERLGKYDIEKAELKIKEINAGILEKEEILNQLNNELNKRQKELAENRFVLNAGIYRGGETIPTGTYKLKILSGTGIIEANKPNKIYERLESDERKRKEHNWAEEYSGVKIDFDTILKIGESAKIEFRKIANIKMSDIEQKCFDRKKEIESEIELLMISLNEKRAKSGNVLTLKRGTYYGGNTLPSGIYNLRIVSGHTMVETKKPSKQISLSAEYEGFDTQYVGLEIREGTTLKINSNAEIEFLLTVTPEELLQSGNSLKDLAFNEKFEERKRIAKQEINVLQEEIKELKTDLHSKESRLRDINKDIKFLQDRKSFMEQQQKFIQEKSKELEERERLQNEIELKKKNVSHEIDNIRTELKILNNVLISKYYNFSDYKDITSQDCKNRIAILKTQENDLRKSGKDVKFSGMSDKGKIKERSLRQILRNFNMECDNIMLNVSLKNIDNSRKKVQQSYDTLNKLYSDDGVSLTEQLLNLKLEQITLMYTYELKYQQEKDIQKAIKEQMIEEAKAEREIEEQKKKIEKDLQQHLGEINRMMKYMQKTQIDVEKQLYMDKIKELEEKIKTLEADKETVLERETNAKAGFVYIISNIGSFGENIYKIGMTRRLEPMDRIKELSSASVPFEFDVHAMIFSSDAPELENTLHKHFADNAVNKVNPRKEFYNVDIDEIEKVVKENYNDTVQFTKIPIATEYRQSLNMQEVAP